jgi:hypothetical protein
VKNVPKCHVVSRSWRAEVQLANPQRSFVTGGLSQWELACRGLLAITTAGLFALHLVAVNPGRFASINVAYTRLARRAVPDEANVAEEHQTT